MQKIISEAASVANVLNVAVFAVGYYFMVRLYREWVRQSREREEAGGRPEVVVGLDHSRLPEVGIFVRNFSATPAKNVTFEFSSPVEDSRGRVISDLPYFAKGLPFLEPQGRLARPWDSLPDLAGVLKEKGLADGIGVTVRFEDLAGKPYESRYALDPLRFEDRELENPRGMDDLVRAVERLSGEIGDGGRSSG